MAQSHRRIVGEALTKVTADLLRAPPLTKQLGDHAAELIVGLDSASMVTCSTRGGSPMSIEGLISAAGSRALRRSSVEALRRSSREIVDGARPSRVAIARRLSPD